jgi:acyl-coenzyme A synthetase/AMP-(fatty) acid ligase
VNIGGLKVHPEEVESVINAHPDVRMSLVRARRNPIMGDIIVADLVLTHDVGEAASALRDDILSHCRARLERHKVPVTLKFVPSLALVAGGKLARNNA